MFFFKNLFSPKKKLPSALNAKLDLKKLDPKEIAIKLKSDPEFVEALESISKNKDFILRRLDELEGLKNDKAVESEKTNT